MATKLKKTTDELQVDCEVAAEIIAAYFARVQLLRSDLFFFVHFFCFDCQLLISLGKSSKD